MIDTIGPEKPDIAIVGAGVVGTAIGVLAARAGYPVVALASRTRASAVRAAERIGPDVAVRDPVEAAGAGQLVLLTVPDDAIEPLAAELARARALRPGAVVAHCSGALGSEVLAGLAEACDASAASLHPLQTFPTVEAALESLVGCYAFCEGEPEALDTMLALARAIGCVAMRITPQRKALYHASACMASNYLATLQEAAIAAAVLAGIGRQPARQALAPLVAATAKNISALGPGAALTGPIARGDVRTVQRHVEALRIADDRLADLYCHLGRRTVDLAEDAGRLDGPTARRLREVLA